MSDGEFDDAEVRYRAAYPGTVVDRNDPEGLGRVRVLIPGLVEPASAWALPVGGVGGGTAGRGFFDVPEVGADVVVLFLMGDVDRPCYLTGWWGRPNGAKEVPTPVVGLGKADAPQVRVYETGRFLLVFDDRSGSETLLLKDKSTGDLVHIQAAETRVKSATKVVVESPSVELGGSPLVPATDGVVIASCPDPFSGLTHGALGGASSVVKAKKT